LFYFGEFTLVTRVERIYKQFEEVGR